MFPVYVLKVAASFANFFDFTQVRKFDSMQC